MIFAETIHLLLPPRTPPRKTQTLRLAYEGDHLARTARDEIAVFERPYQWGTKTISRARWIVGHTYAIQAERCAVSRGRFRCVYLREVLNPLQVDLDFARAEGFDTVEEFVEVWVRLHKKNPVQRCWAIGMELIRTAVSDANGDT